MAECVICKKELSVLTKYPHKGKIYCRKHYDEVMKKEEEAKKKEKHIKDAIQEIMKEYTYDSRKFILHLIRDWKPRRCTNEITYTTSLKKHLDNRLTPVDIYVGKESGLESSRLDLVIGKRKPYLEFAIELKKDLEGASDFDRLKGQIHTYIVGKFKHIIIILIGKTKSQFETELKKYIKEMLEHYSYYTSSLDSIDVVKK